MSTELNPPKDFNEPAVLIRELEELAQGLEVQAQSIRGGALSGVPFPEQLFLRAATVMRFSATKHALEAQTKPVTEAGTETSQPKPRKQP